MTNATDVLLVGGPKNGEMFCVNREGYMPSQLDPSQLNQDVAPYTLRKFWNNVTERWYWIGTQDDTPTDEDIQWQIAAVDFKPAWDLANLPAPTEN